MVPFLVFFWIKVVFSFVIHSGMLENIYSVAERICRGWTWILKIRIHVFKFGTFFFAPREFKCIFASWPSSSHCNFFFNVIYLFSLSVMFFQFTYLAPKLFCFLCFHLSIFPNAFSADVLVGFSFVMLEGLFWGEGVLLDPVPMSFDSRSFVIIVWFISSNSIICLVCCSCFFYFFLSFHSLLHTFAWFRWMRNEVIGTNLCLTFSFHLGFVFPYGWDVNFITDKFSLA